MTERASTDGESAELAALRKRIDEIDRGLVGLLAERRRSVAEVARVKKTLGLGAVDSARELELRERWAKMAREAGVPEEAALGVLDAVLGPSRAHVVALLRNEGGSFEP